MSIIVAPQREIKSFQLNVVLFSILGDSFCFKFAYVAIIVVGYAKGQWTTR